MSGYIECDDPNAVDDGEQPRLDIDDDSGLMSSNVTRHTATLVPGGWTVSWLLPPGRVVDRNQAISAMMIALAVARPEPYGTSLDGLVASLASELDLTGPEAARLAAEEPVAHWALISVTDPARPQCGGSGRSVARLQDVTCPDCRALIARHRAV